MILFHSTTQGAAEAILSGGFLDRTGSYMMEGEFTGVWLANYPLDQNEGCKGDIVLRVDIALSEEQLLEYEVIEDGKPYREWIIPAALVNPNSQVVLNPTEDDEGE